MLQASVSCIGHTWYTSKMIQRSGQIGQVRKGQEISTKKIWLDPHGHRPPEVEVSTRLLGSHQNSLLELRNLRLRSIKDIKGNQQPGASLIRYSLLAYVQWENQIPPHPIQWWAPIVTTTYKWSWTVIFTELIAPFLAWPTTVVAQQPMVICVSTEK